ncbi:MAG: DUF4321 domain-containing protein [Oscillospiraceae bacterium]
MAKWKKNLFFAFYLVAGIILGSLIANVSGDVSFLKWLSYGGTIGFSAANPAVIDLMIFKITFGFSFTVNIAQIITVGLSMWLYSRSRFN